MPLRRRPERELWRRLGGTLCIASGAAHVAVLSIDGAADLTAATLLAMTIGCLWCGVHLLRDSADRAWTVAVILGLAMVAFHTAAGPGMSHTAGDRGSMAAMDEMAGAGTHGSAFASALMNLAVALAALEALLSSAVLTSRHLLGRRHASRERVP